MKIGILYNTFIYKGGAENVIVLLARELVRQGHYVRFITRRFNEDMWGPKASFACEVIEIRLKNVSRYIRNLAMPFFIRRHLAELDIINPHNYPASVWAVLCKKLFRLKGKIICYCQEPNRALHFEKFDKQFSKDARKEDNIFDPKTPALLAPLQQSLERCLDRWAAQGTDLVLVNSRFSQEVYYNIFGVTARVCYLGIHLENIVHPQAAQIKREYFLVFTRIHPLKNVHSVLEAYIVLHQQRGDKLPPLVIAGDGDPVKDLKAMCQQSNVAHKVKFVGFIQDKEIPELMAKALVFIFVPLSEPFGLVTVESLVNSTPVIVSDHGGPSEVVEDNTNGFSVNPIDVNTIASRMAWVLDNPEKARAMGLGGGKAAREKFSDRGFVDRFLEHCSTVWITKA